MANLQQALHIRKNQIPSLVGCYPTAKPDSKQLWVKLNARRLSDVLKEHGLGAGMGFPDFLVGNGVDPYQQLRFGTPARKVTGKELDHMRRGPGKGVDAVGDGVNLEPRKQGLRDFAMFFGHTVDVTAEIQCQHGHVELIFSAQFL